MSGATPLMPVGRSVQRLNRPLPGSCPRNRPSSVRQAVDWTVRCDWLRDASCNIMLTRAARLVQVLQDL